MAILLLKQYLALGNTPAFLDRSDPIDWRSSRSCLGNYTAQAPLWNGNNPSLGQFHGWAPLSVRRPRRMVIRGYKTCHSRGSGSFHEVLCDETELFMLSAIHSRCVFCILDGTQQTTPALFGPTQRRVRTCHRHPRPMVLWGLA